MYSKLIVFVSGIMHIFGRPAAEYGNAYDGSSVEIPPWPPEKNLFSLPTKLNLNDCINMTIDVTTCVSDEIVVNFMGEDYNSQNAVICSIRANMISRMVTIFNEKDQPVVEEQINNFFIDDKKSLFNMWIKRRVNMNTDEDNILEVNTKSFPLKPFVIDYIDQIRYLKLSGNNASMKSLDFKFA